MVEKVKKYISATSSCSSPRWWILDGFFGLKVLVNQIVLLIWKVFGWDRQSDATRNLGCPTPKFIPR